MATLEPLNGVLPIDKPPGPSSHDIVTAARRALRIRRIGHTGTLDPFASGLLLLCVGTATRIAEYLSDMDKRYRATVRLGASTDTDDHTGNVLERHTAAGIQREAVAEALRNMSGDIMQVPPQYSAKKVAGERAYRIARGGGSVDLQPVPVRIYQISIERFDLPDVVLNVHCSSGTYIRSIARDLGRLLGVGAHLAQLRRTAVGDSRVEDAIPLDVLETDVARAADALISPLAALAHLPQVEIDSAGVTHVRHGRNLDCSAANSDAVAVSADGVLVALARVEDGVLRPRKVFV